MKIFLINIKSGKLMSFALVNFIMKPVIDPFIPYWLYIRYKIYMIISSARRNALIRRYRATAETRKWETEQWVMITDENSKDEIEKHEEMVKNENKIKDIV